VPFDLILRVTQLRNLLTAENSTEMANEDEQSGLFGPGLTQANTLATGIKKLDFRPLLGRRRFWMTCRSVHWHFPFPQ
jgi:hypothetical protein